MSKFALSALADEGDTLKEEQVMREFDSGGQHGHLNQAQYQDRSAAGTPVDRDKAGAARAISAHAEHR